MNLTYRRRPTWLNAWLAAEDARPPFSRTAPHIRGRVYVDVDHRTTCGDQMYAMEVVNTRTGKVLITDNCANLGRLVKACHEATAAARSTWFYSLGRKDVR